MLSLVIIVSFFTADTGEHLGDATKVVLGTYDCERRHEETGGEEEGEGQRGHHENTELEEEDDRGEEEETR